mgnify:CR=1 FL=1
MFPVKEEPLAKVKDIISQTLNSKGVRLSWSDPDEKSSLSDSYFVTYTPASETNTVVLNATRDANKNYVDVGGPEIGQGGYFSGKPGSQGKVREFCEIL